MGAAYCSQKCGSPSLDEKPEYDLVEQEAFDVLKEDRPSNEDDGEEPRTPPPNGQAVVMDINHALDADHLQLVLQQQELQQHVKHFDREMPELSSASDPRYASGIRRRVFATGAVYKGDWLEGTRHGFGVQDWPDGARYEGEWSFNKADGLGRFTHGSGEQYVGMWKANCAHGKGILHSPTGGVNGGNTSYMGEWADDLHEGYGIHRSSEEGGGPFTQYQGSYSGGLKDGHGIYFWGDGASYRGTWSKNTLSGAGTYVDNAGCWFRGRWNNSMMHGYGVYTWSDGRVFLGQYIRDKKHGFGTFTLSDGRSYEGFWRMGKQHGCGAFTQVNGDVSMSWWHEGERVSSRKSPMETDEIAEPGEASSPTSPSSGHTPNKGILRSGTTFSSRSKSDLPPSPKSILRLSVQSGASQTTRSVRLQV